MTKLAKKLFQTWVVYVLLISFFTPFSATYLWLYIKKTLIKKEVKAKLIAGLDKSELTHFTFSISQIENELRWEHNREFEYKGEMYDVIETEVLGDSIRYVCWHDKAETKLNRHLQMLIAQKTSNTPEHHARQTLCYKLLKLLVIEHPPELHLTPSQSERTFHSMLIQYKFIVIQSTKNHPDEFHLPKIQQFNLLKR